MDELEFQAQFRPAPAGTVGEILTRRLATPDRDELAEAAAAKAAAEAAAGQREELMMANRAAGDPIGMVSRCQAQLAEERDRVRDLEAQLETARGRLSRAASNLDHWSAEADAVRAAVVQRSDTGDLLGPAKALHQEFVSATRAAFAAVQSGQRPAGRRAPFVSRGQAAVRSEHCVWCTEFAVPDDKSVLLHLDGVPVTPPGAIPAAERERQVQAEREWQAEHAERRTYSYAGEISR